MPVRRVAHLAAALSVSIALVGISGPLSAQSDVPTPRDAPVAAAQTLDIQDSSDQTGDQNRGTGDLIAGAQNAGDPGDNDHAKSPENEQEAKKWTQRVDEAFGEYLVAPIEQVLFYDFRSGPRSGPELDEDGNPVIHPGWLVTRDEPNGISLPFVVVWLFFGATFLTLRMGFINFRAFRHAIDLTRGAYDNPDEPGEVTHFQALSAALSATVGLGNIAGVAIAIGTGGPGATFWIIMIGFLGMTAKFAECTLGQIFRVSDADGRVLGGPMRYLKTGLSQMGLGPLGTVLSILFMVLCIGASFGGGSVTLINQSSSIHLRA
jgi:AGCS family alanine or glycine:cation symporter